MPYLSDHVQIINRCKNHPKLNDIKLQRYIVFYRYIFNNLFLGLMELHPGVPAQGSACTCGQRVLGVGDI